MKQRFATVLVVVALTALCVAAVWVDFHVWRIVHPGRANMDLSIQMNPVNITINVNVARPKTESERIAECHAVWCRALEKLWANRIAHELKNGNQLFANITTHEQYVAACKADDKRRRKELGFWKYHFGS